MPDDKLQRHALIRKTVHNRPNPVVQSSVQLWESLAEELVTIIGEGGFQSLYIRSIHLNSKAFPWMAIEHSSLQTTTRFTNLKKCFEGQVEKNICNANYALLITFIDILALLIGELLTARILHSAWGDDASTSAIQESH